ncbi:MAG TPA: GNAT family N-acetyltransferase, partial [Variovorax sp.]|nr:GNAT family N-acetyltransferase [Variovorax sp.]
MISNWSFLPASALEQQAAAWDATNAAASGVPFLETAFLLPLMRHFANGSLHLAWCGPATAPVAAALLQRDGAGRWSTFQPSQLPLGAWVVTQGQDSARLAHSLLRQLPGLSLGLSLPQLDPRLAPRPTDGPCVQTLDYIDTAWVDIDRPFDTYWEARGKNLRSNMRKQRSKLENEGTPVHFEVLDRPEQMPEAMAEYGRLESAGWKAENGTAVHADNAQGRFYTEMMQAFCRAGRGQVWRLKFGDKIVAMDLCIVGGDTLVILKTAFDPEYRNVSPAFLLKQEAFRHVFDEHRVARIEFYGKVMEWHTRWTDNARRLYHANLFRWA